MEVKRGKWFSVWLLFLVTAFSFAQQKEIKGTVKDASGQPMPGASVVVKGTQNGTETDFDGHFTIRVSQGETLKISFVGMKDKEVKVGTSTRINVVLEEEAQQLSDVVVMGYVKRSVANSTGSSQQLGAAGIENPATNNVESALQGQVAGVQAVSASGTPGAQQDIRIRGVGSFSASNRPLYVIDGVPVNDDNYGLKNSDGSTNYSTISPLASIPSSEIESITVLKDASATAAFGARGSNGVIVINTKRGTSGKAKFTFQSSVGFKNDAINKYRALNAEERLVLLKEGIMNQLKVTEAQALATIEARNEGGYNDWVAEGRPTQDWGDAVRVDNALTYENNFTASGGTYGTKYYFSLGQYKTEGTVVGTDFERLSSSFKVDANLTDKTKVQASVLFSKVNQNPILEQSGYFANPFLTKYLMNPAYRAFDTDGNPNIKNIEKYSGIYNTLYTIQNDIMRLQILRALTTAKIEHKLTKNLTLANNFSMDYIHRDFKNFENRFHGGGVAAGGESSRYQKQNVNFVNQLSLNFVKTIADDHRFDVLALFEYQKNQDNNFSAAGESFPVDGLTNLDNAGKNFTAGSSYTDFLQAAYLGMLNYSYADRIIVDVTFRREGSSKFASGKRFGNFWSIGLAYNLHKDFLGDVFDELKVRGSYGVTGNAGIDINKYQDLLSYSANYGEALASFPANYANSLLTWEKNKTIDVGVDFAFFHKRARGSVAFFDKLTYDLLQDVPLSRTTGFNRQLMNVGDMRNRGFEFQLGFDVISKDKVKWNIAANFSTLKNEVVRLAKDNFGNDLKLFAGSTTKSANVGESYGAWYLKEWVGVDSNTGSPLWRLDVKDADGNVIETKTTSNWNLATQHSNGVSLPKFQGGVSTRLDVGPFFASALFSFQGGHKILNEYATFQNRTSRFSTAMYNGSADLLNRWQKPGDITDVPKINYTTNDNSHMASTRFLYDGTFVRLRNVQVGYNLTSEYLGNIGINGVTVSVTGSNLFTWVKDKNLQFDPETEAAGYIRLTTPPVKTIMTSLTLNF